jgi:hypothetical protein
MKQRGLFRFSGFSIGKSPHRGHVSFPTILPQRGEQGSKALAFRLFRLPFTVYRLRP